MTSRQIDEWRAFEALEEFPDRRAEYGVAHIVQTLARTGKPLKDYLLPFGDTPLVQSTDPVHTPAFIESELTSWMDGANRIHAEKSHNR